MISNFNNRERFVRWQGVLREHLTFLNNLVLTFSVGTIGFLLNLLNGDNFNPKCCQKIFFTFGFLMTFISVALGFITSFNRLHDFRTTTKKIKNEIKEELSELEHLKWLMEMYRKTTWGFFYGQLIIFCLAVFSLIISFLMIYNDKLF